MKKKLIKKKNKYLLKRFFIFTGLILFGYLIGSRFAGIGYRFKSISLNNNPRVETISPRNLSERLKNKNFVFINVHTPYEGEIEKTDTFIDFDSMVAEKTKLPADKSAEIILYCRSGKMSQEAVGTLNSLGYVNVKHLEGGMDKWQKDGYKLLDLSKLPEEVLPEAGFSLPISWGDLGPRLVQLGVIDLAKFEKSVAMDDTQKSLLTKGTDAKITINARNSQFVVDMLWAVGLAQKSLVYDEGPMGKEYKDKVGNFSSTGGWNLAKGKATDYLNKYELVKLSPDQRQKVAEIAKNVYRPCCGNSTWFPDCNHGMAALAAIELMVSQGIPDDEIYKNVLKLNSFWFGNSYLTTATYFARQGISWDKVDAKEVLGQKFSSGQGAATIAKEVGILPYGAKSGGGCGA